MDTGLAARRRAQTVPGMGVGHSCGADSLRTAEAIRIGPANPCSRVALARRSKATTSSRVARFGTGPGPRTERSVPGRSVPEPNRHVGAARRVLLMRRMRSRTALHLFLAFLFGASGTALACNGARTTGAQEGTITSDASDMDTSATEALTDALDAGSDADGPSHTQHLLSTVPTFHRPAALACTETRAPGDLTDCTAGEVGDASILCTDDSSCTAGTSGRCECSWGAAPNPFGTMCTYDDCASDNDCGSTVCLCRETPLPGIQPDPARRTICAGSGNCKVDSDCDGGGYCSPSPAFQCGSDHWDYYGYYCHTGGDECINDSDCAPQGNAFCAYNPAVQHWACSTGSCEDG